MEFLKAGKNKFIITATATEVLRLVYAEARGEIKL